MKLKIKFLFLTIIILSNSNILFALEDTISDVVTCDDNEEPFLTTRIPDIVWLMIGRHIDNGPNGLALGLVRLSLVNRDLRRIFTNGTIAEQLLSTYFFPTKDKKRKNSLLHNLIRKNHHGFLATLLQKAENHSDFVAWKSLGSLNQSFWFFIFNDIYQVTSDCCAIGLAAKLGHVASLKALLAYGPNLEKKCEDSTPLMKAAQGGHLECLKELIAARADLNAITDGASALTCAIKNQHNACIEALIANGADILNYDPKTSFTSLGIAIKLGNLNAVKLMLKRLKITGPDLDALVGHRQRNLPLMMVAAINNQYDVIELIFNLGGSIEVPNPQTKSRPLMIAAENGHLETVQKLLELNADVNAKDELQYTALMDASMNGHIQVVQKLLDNQADVNAKNSFGNTALAVALNYGKDETIKVLLKAQRCFIHRKRSRSSAERLRSWPK